jgi:U3 small nucleolar RNA-associated protein 23
MRIKRYKQFRKHLKFYRHSFGIDQPFKVLLDGTFIHAAFLGKLQVRDQVTKMLNVINRDKIKIYVPRCVISELEHLGRPLSGALFIAKTFDCLECGHSSGSGAACISRLIGSKNDQKYVVASQDEALKTAVRQIPGCPLLIIHGGSVPMLEAPSRASEKAARENGLKMLKVSDWERNKLPELRRQDAMAARKKKKKLKGANPLSCKKKKIDKNNDKQTNKKEKATAAERRTE